MLNYANIINNLATVKLYDSIGVDSDGKGISGADVSEFIDYVNTNCPEVECIDVRISSNGGSVNDGLIICTAILNSKIPVATYIDGMALSIAGVIAMCGSVRKMADYGTFMMHDAKGGTDEDVLNLITNSLAKIFEKTTFLTLDKCRDLMKKETWMDANECMILGLVDEIIITNNKKPVLTNEVELVEFYNSFITKKPKMIKLTNKLKLSNDASEDSIIEKVEAIEVEADTAKAELDALKVENETLKTKLATFEEAEKAKEVAAKDEVIANAIKEGKIVAESKDKWSAVSTNSSDLKNLFDSLKTVPAFVPVLDAAKVVNKADDRAEWTFSDWEKKDSKGLAEIQNNNPEEFKRLISTINTTLKSKK